LAKKRTRSSVQLPPSIKRLASVLAEIAQNEVTCAPTIEPVCDAGHKVKREGKNPLEINETGISTSQKNKLAHETTDIIV
jgi:hypothetical protein